MDHQIPEDDKDLNREHFWKHLRVDGKSCVYECEKDGRRVIIKYESDDTQSHEEREPEPRGKLISRMKPKDGPPNQIPTIRKQRYCFRPSTSLVEREKQNWRVVYEKDDCPSDLEIMESISFNKASEGTSAVAFTKQARDNIFISTKYRRQIIDVLKEPYDEEEYEKLLVDVEVCKPGQRHIELRNGRDRSLPKAVGGKSYLDYYPDLEIKLSHFGDDKLLRLNLLRGLFFWLQHSVQSGAFMPWLDEECLAMQCNRTSILL